MIGIQKYIRAQSLEEAYQLNQSRANRVMGGMLWLKTGKGNVNTEMCIRDRDWSGWSMIYPQRGVSVSLGGNTGRERSLGTVF